MTKQEAIDLFGSKVALQGALKCTRQLLHGWKPELTQAQSDRVIGAAMRIGVERDNTAKDWRATIDSLV